MGDSWGLETPLWFAPKGVEPKDIVSFRRSNDFKHVKAEVLATRNGVGVTEIANFASDGLTHVDLSATGALAAGPVTLAPTAHLVIPSNGLADFTKPGVTHDVKGWLGLTLTWSKPLTPAPVTQE